MKTYISKGLSGTASRQYSDYLLFVNNSRSSDTYVMSTPVALMNSRAPFESDATVAYQNALVKTRYMIRNIRVEMKFLTDFVVFTMIDVDFHWHPIPCRQGH